MHDLQASRVRHGFGQPASVTTLDVCFYAYKDGWLLAHEAAEFFYCGTMLGQH